MPQHLQHHEATTAFQKVFKGHVEKLLTALENEENPFQDDSNVLFAIDSTVVADESSIKAVHDAFKIGEEQYKDFVERRLKERTTPVTAPIPRNKLIFFAPKKEGKKDGTDLLKNDCYLLFKIVHCVSKSKRQPP